MSWSITSKQMLETAVASFYGAPYCKQSAKPSLKAAVVNNFHKLFSPKSVRLILWAPRVFAQHFEIHPAVVEI